MMMMMMMMCVCVCVCVCVWSVTQYCLTLYDLLDYSPPDSSVHGIIQARVLEWVTISSRDLIKPGIESTSPVSPALQVDSLLSEPPEKPFSSVQFNHSVVSDSLWPHELQHARPPCSSPTPKAYSNSCPLSQWYHLTISSSVIPFSSHLQSFPPTGSFQMSQVFTKVLVVRLQHQSFQWIFRTDFL